MQKRLIVARDNTDRIIINRKIQEKINGKKNKSMDVSSYKQRNSHPKILGHAEGKETLREKLNLW